MGRTKSCNKCNKPKRPKGKDFAEKPGYCECGRPPKIDATVLQKLEDAFSNSLPDREACLYAGISPTTLYEYQKQNPEYAERKEALKLTPNMAARKTIVKTLHDVRVAQWWLEKRDPEYSPKTKVEHSGAVEVVDSLTEMSPEEKTALEALQVARRKRIEKSIKPQTTKT